MKWHDADSCGLATGEVNGIDVLDVDVRPPGGREGALDGEGKDGFAALAQLGLALPKTLTAQTPRGGHVKTVQGHPAVNGLRPNRNRGNGSS
jgi:hypothetical protein